jgi:hypothetical protein
MSDHDAGHEPAEPYGGCVTVFEAPLLAMLAMAVGVVVWLFLR